MPDTAVDIGSSVQLTPDQIAAAQPVAPAQPAIGAQVQLTPDQVASAKPVQLDPLRDFTADQLVALEKQDPDNFNIANNYAARKDLHSIPGMNQKVADAYVQRLQTPLLDTIAPGEGVVGRTWGAIKEGASALKGLVTGAVKRTSAVAQAVATPVGALVTAPFTTPETTANMFNEGQRQFAETTAASEAGLNSLANTARAASDIVARHTGLATPLDKLSPDERVAMLFDAMNRAQKTQQIQSGHGPVLETLGNEVVKNLAASGTPVRPSEVAAETAGDPFSWYLMGKGFQGAGAAIPKAVTQTAGKIAEGAGNVAAKVGGQVVETGADLTALGARAVGAVAPVSSAAIGAVKGAAIHGPAGFVTGAGLGYKAGQAITEGAKNLVKKAELVSNIGEQIAGKVPVAGATAQLGRDILQSAPAAAGEVAKGAAFDLGLAAASSEEAPSERSGVGIGTAFGLLGAGKTMGQRVLSGQIIAPREYGSKVSVPPTGQFPALDALNKDSLAGSDPGTVAHVNALKQFARDVDPNSEVFFGKDQAALEAALKQSGMSDEDAKKFANAEGFFTASLPGADGNAKRIIVVKNPDSAPHEAFHAVQDVLGEQGNQAVDQIIKQSYGPEWENIGNDQATSLAGPAAVKQKGWRNAILDHSGWGAAQAAEKQYRDTFNRLSNETGAVPTPETVKSMIDPNKPWDQVLTPEESNAVADKYIARELGAENFDAVFKHSTDISGNQKAPVISRLSKVVANLVSNLGGEPLAGRVSEGQNYPLKYQATQAVTEAAKSARAGAPVVEPKNVLAGARPSVGVPVTPQEQQDAATEARTIAAEAPAAPPATAGAPTAGAKSPRELLGAMAEAIASRSGVKINYSSAPGEPAAAITSTRPIRRSIIEAFRTMPEAARALWEKNFFPERVIKTKSGYQVMGWAPEVFAANAHKLAQTLVDVGTVASPYELDPKARSFSPAGWQELYNDVSKFVGNQMAGKTGAGGKLVVPASVTEKGFTAPPVSGGEGKLDQRKADFINMLYNFKLPESPRITSGKLPLNVAGQRISEATTPGRVSSPVEPKLPYSGKAAQALGIEGQNINEVNPFRSEVEQAAKGAGVKMPSMVEAIQRLDLAHIKEVQAAPELNQFRGNSLTLTAGFQPTKGQFSPTAEMESLKSDEKWASLRTYKGKYGGGPTGWAFDVGASAKTPEDIQAFKSTNELYATMGKEAMKNKDYDAASQLFTKAQIAREAFEVATGQKIDGTPGQSGGVEMVRRKDPNYLPPVLEKPEVQGQAQPERNKDVETVAKDYAKEAGINYAPPSKPVTVNPELAKKVADFYDEATHDPKNPDVVKSYDALKNETVAQYEAITKAGYKMEPWTGTGEPYANSAAMTEDVSKNKHLWFKPTGEDIKGENLMMQNSGINDLPLNDVFRAVHDFFGHAKEGNQFGPSGELNAWREHSAMYSPEAQGALAAETLAQNSWVNFGQHLRDEAGNIPAKGTEGYKGLAERPFAEQKNITVPPEMISEAQGNKDQFQPKEEKPEPTDLLERRAGPGGYLAGYWLSPDGKYYDASPSHEASAEKYITGPIKGDSREAAYKQGWVRVNLDRTDGNQILIEGAKPNKTQRASLEDAAFHFELPVHDDSGRVVIDSTKEFASGQFTSKKNEDYKLKPASSGFSKAWILPNGVPVQLGGQWHHEWLAQQPELRKKYGIRQASVNNDNSRTDALAKGFARINYDAKTGTVTVEARQKDLPNLRPSLEKFMQANLPQIDRAQFYLFNDKVDQVADSGSATLFDKPKADRMAAIPFLSAPGDITETSPQATPGALSEQGAPGAVPKRGKVVGQAQPLKDEGPSLGERATAFGGMNFKSWMNPSGKTIPLTEHARTHEGLAQNILGGENSGSGENSANLYKKGWLRVAPYGGDSLMANTVSGKPISPKQKSELINQAIEQGFNKIYFDNGNTYKMIWSGDESASGQFQVKRREEQGSLEGIGGKEPLSTVALANMTKDEVAQYYPEAVIERRKFEPIPSNIIDSPLAKAAGSEPEAVDAFAKKLVEFARTKEHTPEYQQGQKWYKDFVPQLKKEFGKDSTIFAELLAATSPNTGVTTNFGYAYDALQGLKSGRFDKLIPKFEEGLQKIADDSWEPWLRREVKAGKATGETSAAFLARWIEKYDLKPKQSNGSLYGQHSVPVLSVFARQWMDRNTGPKTRTFVSNLLGTGHEATIDVWADRTMRRLGYEGFKDRWRILPQNSTGVSDPDFYFAQKAFKKAASELGMNADDLQGALWFAEKQHWADNGWGRLDLGSFQSEMKKIPLLKAGVEQRLQITAAKSKAAPLTAGELGFSVEPRKLK